MTSEPDHSVEGTIEEMPGMRGAAGRLRDRLAEAVEEFNCEQDPVRRTLLFAQICSYRRRLEGMDA